MLKRLINRKILHIKKLSPWNFQSENLKNYFFFERIERARKQQEDKRAKIDTIFSNKRASGLRFLLCGSS